MQKYNFPEEDIKNWLSRDKQSLLQKYDKVQ